MSHTAEDAKTDGVVVPKTLDEYCIKAVPKDDRNSSEDFYDDDDYYVDDCDEDDIYESDDDDSGNEESWSYTSVYSAYLLNLPHALTIYRRIEGSSWRVMESH